MATELSPPMSSNDPAQAFEALRSEVSLLRRAVEGLTAERQAAPDYRPTLTAMAERLTRIAESPAMQFTPETMTQAISQAAKTARAEDRQTIEQGQRQLDASIARIDAVVDRAQTADRQKRWLIGTGVGGALAGIVLWSFLPGAIARAMPQRWHLPEALAAHIVGEPTLWNAGTRLLSADNPQGWEALAAAAQMRHDNRTALAACEKAAAKAAGPVRCTIRVEPPARR